MNSFVSHVYHTFDEDVLKRLSDEPYIEFRTDNELVDQMRRMVFVNPMLYVYYSMHIGSFVKYANEITDENLRFDLFALVSTVQGLSTLHSLISRFDYTDQLDIFADLFNNLTGNICIELTKYVIKASLKNPEYKLYALSRLVDNNIKDDILNFFIKNDYESERGYGINDIKQILQRDMNHNFQEEMISYILNNFKRDTMNSCLRFFCNKLDERPHSIENEFITSFIFHYTHICRVLKDKKYYRNLLAIKQISSKYINRG